MSGYPDSYPPVELPDWAIVSPPRRRHIERVTWLVDAWAGAMNLDPSTARDWHDAARLHDSLRDADEPTLRAIVHEPLVDAGILHGPAAALLLERDGESRNDVLDAVRHHTIGSAHWSSTGRALFCADFLEPGRKQERDERDALAAAFSAEPETVFREVVRRRLAHALKRGRAIHPATIETWNGLL